MSFLSGLFGGGGGESGGVQARPDLQYKSGQKLYDFAASQQGKYPYEPAAPYTGKLSAPRTETQQAGQNLLSSYVGGQAPEQFGQAGAQISKTLEGGYDPRTSPYYTAMKDQIMRDAGEARDAIMRQSAASGMLHSDPRRIQERQLAENTTGQLSNLLGGLYEAERGRQMQAVPQALELGRLSENLPLTRIQAAEQYGGLPQQFEQSSLDRQYNEYLRQLEGAREPYNIYEGLTARQFEPYAAPTVYPQQTGASSGGFLSSFIPSFMGSFGGGGGGQTGLF